MPTKSNFYFYFFCLLLFEGTFTFFFQRWKVKKSHKIVGITGFSYYFCMMIEGSRSGSGPIPLNIGSGSGSRRPKNMWIRIRIRNTGYQPLRENETLTRFNWCQGWYYIRSVADPAFSSKWCGSDPITLWKCRYVQFLVAGSRSVLLIGFRIREGHTCAGLCGSETLVLGQVFRLIC